MKNEDVCYTNDKKIKTESGIYGNPAEIPVITKNQLHLLRSLNRKKG